MSFPHRDSVVNPLPALLDMPTVSVITPSYNTGRFIEQTLRSVQMQDYPFIEHIVLDSGSTDETFQILARYPSVRVVNPAPQGVCEKTNLGFSIARGDILAWLCADDYYFPGAISKAVAALKDNPDTALVYSNNLVVDERGAELQRVRSPQVGFEELVEMDYVPPQTAVFRRHALESVGLLDTRYPLMCDWDLWIRISKAFPILCVDDWWGAMRAHPGQLSDRHKYAKWKEARRLSREKYGRPFFSPMFWNYWSAKSSRAAAMLRKGQFRLFWSKLHGIARGLVLPSQTDR